MKKLLFTSFYEWFYHHAIGNVPPWYWGWGRYSAQNGLKIHSRKITASILTPFSELLPNLDYSPIKKLENISLKLLGNSVHKKNRSKAIVYDFVEENTDVQNVGVQHLYRVTRTTKKIYIKIGRIEWMCVSCILWIPIYVKTQSNKCQVNWLN